MSTAPEAPGGSAEPDASATRSRRRPLVVGLVLVVVAAVAAVVALRVLDDDAVRAQPGQLLVTGFQDDSGTDVDLELPFGTVRLSVGEPSDALPDTVDLPRYAAPDDGSILALGWQVADGTAGLQERPLPRSGVDDVVNPTLSVVADGEEYDVGELPLLSSDGTYVDVQQRVYLALGSDPREVTLRLDYAGRTQEVTVQDGEETSRDEGEFAVYRGGYPADETAIDLPARLPAGLTAVEPVSDLAAQVTYVSRVPYVAGLGWAPDGSDFVTVTAALPGYPRVLGRAGGVAVVQDLGSLTGTEADYTLAGEPALAVVDLNAIAGGLSLQSVANPVLVVFEVPEGSAPGALEITVRQPVESTYPEDPDSARDVEPVRDAVPLLWRTRLPALAP